jgi:ADP-ribosylglycohydrolase
VLKGAVLLGNDTDTTAAVAGGVVGVREGVHGIPTRWREALRGRELLEPLLSALLLRGP